MLGLHTLRASGYTAIVRAPDGVRFTVSAASAAARAAQLVDYISARCEYTLWPPAAARVRALIDVKNTDAAIAAYFANVGDRWDEEQLELRSPSSEMP